MKITVLDDYPEAFCKLSAAARLAGHEVVAYADAERDLERLVERLADSDAVLLTQQRTPFPRALIERLPRLRLIAQTGDHVEHLDVCACTERGIVITAGRGGRPPSTVELTWGLILSSRRNIPHEVQMLKRGVWQTTVGRGLRGRVLGIYGFGRIGAGVAEVGRAFGMKVLCYGRAASQERARAAGFDLAESRDVLFEAADVLSLHVNLNEETRAGIGVADLARMKPDALIVNTGRAALIAPGALVDALRGGRPGYAAVDVFETEPMRDPDHPLLRMPNVVCTPHLGYVESDTLDSYYGIAVDGILAFVAGKPINVLNPSVLKHGRAEAPGPGAVSSLSHQERG